MSLRSGQRERAGFSSGPENKIFSPKRAVADLRLPTHTVTAFCVSPTTPHYQMPVTRTVTSTGDRRFRECPGHYRRFLARSSQRISRSRSFPSRKLALLLIRRRVGDGILPDRADSQSRRLLHTRPGPQDYEHPERQRQSARHQRGLIRQVRNHRNRAQTGRCCANQIPGSLLVWLSRLRWTKASAAETPASRPRQFAMIS